MTWQRRISNVPVQSNARPRRRWRGWHCAGSAGRHFGFRFWHQGAANPQDDVNTDGDAADDSVECNGERRRLGADVVGRSVRSGCAGRIVAAELGGVVSKIEFENGGVAKKGDLIIKLDASAGRSAFAVRRAEAELGQQIWNELAALRRKRLFQRLNWTLRNRNSTG